MLLWEYFWVVISVEIGKTGNPLYIPDLGIPSAIGW